MVTSQLPLGGGAVLPPSRTPDVKRRTLYRGINICQGGMKILGVIYEVCHDYAVISLPTMLVGYVHRDEDDENNGGELSGSNSLLPSS